MNTMCRRILVIDSTYGKSSFINRFLMEPISSKPFEFQEIDTYDFNKNLYQFIIVPELREEDFYRNATQAKLLIRERLLSYEKAGLHLIIFYANDTLTSLLSYNTFNFIVWNMTRTIPIISIVNTIEHDKNFSYWKSQNDLTGYISRHTGGVYILTETDEQSNTTKEIWEIIEKHVIHQVDDERLINQKEGSQDASKPVSMVVKSKENRKIKMGNSLGTFSPRFLLKLNLKYFRK